MHSCPLYIRRVTILFIAVELFAQAGEVVWREIEARGRVWVSYLRSTQERSEAWEPASFQSAGSRHEN